MTIEIKLTEKQIASFKGAAIVTVTGKTDNNGIFFGHNETVVKVQVTDADYEQLETGNKLALLGDKLTDKSVLVELPKAAPVKRNPPAHMFADRMPQRKR